MVLAVAGSNLTQSGSFCVRKVITPLKNRFPTPAGEVGFEHACPHSFRHYFVSEAFRRGATEPWIMQWVGHRESRIVARYRHLRDDDGQREMARLDLLRSPSEPGWSGFGLKVLAFGNERVSVASGLQTVKKGRESGIVCPNDCLSW